MNNSPKICGNNPKWCENCVSKGKCASTRPQATNNDLISREALIKAVNELYEYAELGEALDVIKAAPTVEERIDPNDIFYLCDRKKCGENHNCYLCNHTTDIRHAVNFDLVDFPRSAFVERARPRGEWIKDDNDLLDFRKCSNCGEWAEYLDGGSQFLSNYCPNCGADMRKEAADD